MRCREARASYVEIELELIRPERRDAFDAHLRGCSDCVRWVAEERELSASLATLREELSFEIDVRARVADGLESLRPAARRRLPARELAWSGGIAASLAAALAVGLWQLAPSLPLLLIRARTLGSTLASAGSTLTAPIKSFIAGSAKFLGDLASSFGKLAGNVESLQPVAILMVAVCTLMMAASIVLVVGRDIRRPTLVEEDFR